MKPGYSFLIAGALLFAACTPSNRDKEATDTVSIRDTTRSNSALDTAAVNNVEGSGAPDTAGYPVEENNKQNSGGTRTNIGQDTAGEFKKKAY